jgi:hypothetical protein
MLISAMRENDTIEMYVIDSHVYSLTTDTNKGILNGNNNNNNNNNSITSKHITSVLSDDLSIKNTRTSSINRLDHQTLSTSYSDLYDRSKYLNNISDRSFSGSIPILSTGRNTFLCNSNILSLYSGITASPADFRSISSKRKFCS